VIQSAIVCKASDKSTCRYQSGQLPRSPFLDRDARSPTRRTIVVHSGGVPRSSAQFGDMHDLYFEPMYEEFRPRTIGSLSNAFTSAFKELDRSCVSPVAESKRSSRRSRSVSSAARCWSRNASSFVTSMDCANAKIDATASSSWNPSSSTTPAITHTVYNMAAALDVCVG
jgi:hypothetical protein